MRRKVRRPREDRWFWQVRSAKLSADFSSARLIADFNWWVALTDVKKLRACSTSCGLSKASVRTYTRRLGPDWSIRWWLSIRVCSRIIVRSFGRSKTMTLPTSRWKLHKTKVCISRRDWRRRQTWQRRHICRPRRRSQASRRRFGDSWSWRRRMWRFLQFLKPDHLWS